MLINFKLVEITMPWYGSIPFGRGAAPGLLHFPTNTIANVSAVTRKQAHQHAVMRLLFPLFKHACPIGM